jgi:hypothetical protein
MANANRGTDKTVLAHALYVLTSIAIDAGADVEARRTLDQYEQWIQRSLNENSEWQGRLHLERARILYASKNYDRAHLELDQAMRLFQQAPTAGIVDEDEALDLLHKLTEQKS